MKIFVAFYNVLFPLLWFLALPFLWLLGRSQNDRIRYQIYSLARCYGYSKQNALILVKQSNLETGFQTSNLAINYNNLFGMMNPKKRLTQSIGGVSAEDGMEFAVFGSTYASILDRFQWDEFNKIDVKSTRYLDMVYAKGYATDGEYLKKVMTTSLSFNPNAGFIVTTIYSLLAVVGFIYFRYLR